MLQFVILTHDHPHLHWDLMVERAPEGLLRTWRLECPPFLGCSIHAEALADHRRLYLDYEGPVSNNRGVVSRWDAGKLEILSESEAVLVLQLSGQKIRGHAVLKQEIEQTWIFQWREPELPA